jgi:hypothetical protein
LRRFIALDRPFLIWRRIGLIEGSTAKFLSQSDRFLLVDMASANRNTGIPGVAMRLEHTFTT